MRLLFLSTIRHIRKHFFQTIITFLITFIFVSMLSAIFHFAIGFQGALRQYSIDTVGTYHYKWIGKQEELGFMEEMAAQAKEDPWFSEVCLKQENTQPVLYLTVAKPGIFTTRTMYKKLDNILSKMSFRGAAHNWDLLVSYGDLWKENGSYSFLMIFLFFTVLISAAAVLTLGAVFRMSAEEREKDFALFSSVGVSGKQLGRMVLFEGMLYFFAALPIGNLFGIYLLTAVKEKINYFLKGLGDLPSIEITASFSVIITITFTAAVIIFVCLYSPIKKVTKQGAIDVMRQNKLVYIPKKDLNIAKKSGFFEKQIIKLFGVEGLLAYKTHRRLRRRYYPVLTVLAVNIALCFAISSLGDYTSSAIAGNYNGLDYNMEIQLSGENTDILAEAAKETVKRSDDIFVPFRQAAFELCGEMPLSEQGKQSGLFGRSGRMPDIVLISVGEKRLSSLCEKYKIDFEKLNKNTGVFINAKTTWRSGNKKQTGRIFSLKKEDTIQIGSNHAGASMHETEITAEIEIVGVMDEWPDYIAVDEPTSLVLLVSEETFLELEAKRPFAKFDEELHYIYLRGMVPDTKKLQTELVSYFSEQEKVSFQIYNYKEEIQQKQATADSIRYLLGIILIAVMLSCLFGNLSVTWAIDRVRIREFAVFISVGMTPEAVSKMKRVENLLNAVRAFVPGTAIGLLCSYKLYQLYLEEYNVAWGFSWKGFVAGILLLWLVFAVSQYIVGRILRKDSIVEVIVNHET